MMSFPRRLELKAVIAAKKPSVIAAAGPLQHGVGCQDGANKMIESIQYFAEADQSRAFVALDLKAAFQNVSRRSMLHSLGQHDSGLATVFSRWFSGTTIHRMHHDGSYAHIKASTRAAHCHPAVLRQLSTTYHGTSLPKPNAPSTAEPSCGHIWTTGTSRHKPCSERHTLHQP